MNRQQVRGMCLLLVVFLMTGFIAPLRIALAEDSAVATLPTEAPTQLPDVAPEGGEGTLEEPTEVPTAADPTAVPGVATEPTDATEQAPASTTTPATEIPAGEGSSQIFTSPLEPVPVEVVAILLDCTTLNVALQGVDDLVQHTIVVDINGQQIARYIYSGAQVIPVAIANGDVISVYIEGSILPSWQFSPSEGCGGEMEWGEPPVATIVSVGCDLSYEVHVDPESIDTSTWLGNHILLMVTLTPGLQGGGSTLIYLVDGQSTYTGILLGDPGWHYFGVDGQINSRNGQALDTFTFAGCDGYPIGVPGPPLADLIAEIIKVLTRILGEIVGGDATRNLGWTET